LRRFQAFAPPAPHLDGLGVVAFGFLLDILLGSLSRKFIFAFGLK
jgi:hypothetical protein